MHRREFLRTATAAALVTSFGQLPSYAAEPGGIARRPFGRHKDPDFHVHMLEAADKAGFKFDSVQMPLNVMDAHFLSFTQKVVPELIARNIAILGMKPLGARDILKSNTVTAVECLQYAMSLPVVTTITGCDSMEILNQALGVARGFQPLGNAAITALLARTEAAAAKGEYEHYKFATYPS